jgi:hypothetical protein
MMSCLIRPSRNLLLPTPVLPHTYRERVSLAAAKHYPEIKIPGLTSRLRHLFLRTRGVIISYARRHRQMSVVIFFMPLRCAVHK